MNITRDLLRSLDPCLFDLIQPCRVTDDAQMPWAYQAANPNGRPLSNDWGVVGLLPALQPWQRIPRMYRAYRVPQPFRQVSGKSEKRWMLWDAAYPQSPGIVTEMRDYRTTAGNFSLLHAIVDCALDDGEAAFEAWIGGAWRVAFTQYHKAVSIPFVGTRTVKFYRGLRPDLNVSPPENIGGAIRSDMCCWFPECGVTLVK